MRWALSLLGLTLELSLYRDEREEYDEAETDEAVEAPVTVSGTLVDAGPTDALLGFQSPAVEPCEWE